MIVIAVLQCSFRGMGGLGADIEDNTSSYKVWYVNLGDRIEHYGNVSLFLDESIVVSGEPGAPYFPCYVATGS